MFLKLKNELNLRIFTLLVFFLLGSFYTSGYSSFDDFYSQKRIGGSFRPTDPLVKNANTAHVSGGLVYLTQTVGYYPDLKTLSPGMRLTIDAGLPYDFSVKGVYTKWSSERSVKFTVPIFNIEREIETVNRLNNLEVLFGKNLRLNKSGIFTPFIGIEACSESSIVTINEDVTVSNAYIAGGAEAGLKAEYSLHKYLTAFSSASASCLKVGHRRHVDMDLCYQTSGVLPGSKIAIGSALTFPFEKGMKSLRLEGGYEMQYRWHKDLQGAVDWSHPITLQGFSGSVLLQF